MPASRAIANRLLRALAVIEKQTPHVLADREAEDLHKLRVAVRQSRALLKATGHCLPPATAAYGKRKLRWLGRVTTPVRDLDVLLATPAAAPCEAFTARLQAKRAQAWQTLAAALRSAKFARFCRRWREALRKAPKSGPSIQAVADESMLAAADRFVTDARALEADSPPDALHTLRKDGKQLRYLLEFFRSLYPRPGVKALLQPLKQAQEALGDYQDLAAHAHLLANVAEAQPYLQTLAAEEPARRERALAALAPFRQAGALDAYRDLTASGVTPASRTLVLWRHAKSDRGDGTLPDVTRPLAPRGRRTAPRMAAWIAGHWPPDAVICSPARRTVETWQHLAPLLPPGVPVRFDARAYLADPAQCRALIAAAPPQAETLLLIGHNPGLEDLAAELAEPVAGKFATAAVAVLQFSGDWCDLAPGSARLVRLKRPRRKPSSAAGAGDT